MAKTKEIEGYIYENHLPWLLKQTKMPFMPDGCEEENSGPRLKAKLIVTIPERKVTITESEFDEMAKQWLGPDSRKEFKEKLFARES